MSIEIFRSSRALRLLAALLIALHAGVLPLDWHGQHAEACSDSECAAQIAWSAPSDADDAEHHDCRICDLVLSGHTSILLVLGSPGVTPPQARVASRRTPVRASLRDASRRISPRGPPAS